jgi:hypothetical protein
MTPTETRTLPSGLTVNIIRPTIDIAPLALTQVEQYLADQPAPESPQEAWIERTWKLLEVSAKNAAALSGKPPEAITVSTLQAKFSSVAVMELNAAIFEISGLRPVVSTGEASAVAPSENTSDSSAAA